jgi:hypothetical protein
MPTKQSFRSPVEDRTKLYKKYFPEEFEKYKHEGRAESDLEKKFQKRVAKGGEFHFSDGKVAYNLLSWLQCIQIASHDIIALHLRNKEFEQWLEEKVKAPELALVCQDLKRSLENGAIAEKEVKSELFNRFNTTTLSNSIFETLTLPLLKKLKSNDRSKVEEAIDKLLVLGDSRVVEPLLERVFDSRPQVRHKIINGLGRFKDKRVTPTLLKILKHSTEQQERFLAVRALGLVRDKRAVNTLKEIKKAEKDTKVGKAAQEVVEELDKR